MLCLAERSREGQHSGSLHQSHICGEFPGSSYQLLSKHTAHPDDTCTLTLFVPKLISRLVAALQKDVLKKKKNQKKICLLSSVVYLEFQVWELSWGTPARTVSAGILFFFSLKKSFLWYLEALWNTWCSATFQTQKAFWACSVLKRQCVNLPVKRPGWIILIIIILILAFTWERRWRFS